MHDFEIKKADNDKSLKENYENHIPLTYCYHFQTLVLK